MTYQTIEYCEIVRAAHDTASKLLNRGAAAGTPAARYIVTVNTEGGQTASVSWAGRRVTMSLPSFKPDTRLTRIEADRIVGFIAHECCHVLHSDWKVWQDAVSRGPTIARLTNAIEDVRIEAAEITSGYLPNLRNVLSETLNAKHWESIQDRATQGKPAIGSAAVDVAYVLCVLGRLANGYSVPCAAGLAHNVAPRFRPIVAYALKRLPKLTNNRAALKLAVEIAARLAALTPAPGPQPQPTDQPQTGQPQDGESQPGDGEGQPGDDESQDGEGQDDEGQDGDSQEGPSGGATSQDAANGDPDSPEDTEAAGGPSEGRETGDGKPTPDQDPCQETGTGAGGGGEPDLTPIEPDAAALDHLIRATMERTGDAAASPDLSALNTFAGGTTTPLAPAFGGGAYMTHLRNRTAKPAKLRNQVAQIIRSQERHGHERYRSVGRMDRRALARIACGAANVYTRRTFVPGVDTAVLILVDGSGSMGSVMPLAHLMALHLAESIEAARGKVCIAGFWGRQAEVTLAIAKGFNERFDPAKLAGFGAQTSTPLAASILAGADLLREVHADRKIILVLTDGACDLGPECVKAAVSMVNRRGVECAGIGIDTDVSYAFPVNVRVDNPNQLATEGLATLVRVIEAGRQNGNGKRS